MHCYLCVWVSRRTSSLHKPLKVLLVMSATLKKRVQDCNSLNVFKCPLSLLGYYQAQLNLHYFIADFVGGKYMEFCWMDLNMVKFVNQSWEHLTPGAWQMFQFCVNLQIFQLQIPWACYKFRTQNSNWNGEST